MDDNEFMLMDRIQKVQQIVGKYGEDNFYISFSGGKDSTIIHHLVDMALPGNRIPRVYANTGIEFKAIYQFVHELQESDDRILIIKPSVNIRQALERDGYPFKSKKHSAVLSAFQRNGYTQTVKKYLGMVPDDQIVSRSNMCIKKLRYQFEEGIDLKVSDKCCVNMKEKPLRNWQKENNKKISIIGLRQAEEGRRKDTVCLAFRGNSLKSFHPLAPVSDEFEQWFVDKYDIKLASLYYPPYNFRRTGCKGCPFSIEIQNELDIMEKFFPAERKQCETIWKPVYDEYRRIGYRLKPYEEQLNLFNEMEEEE